MLGPPTSGPVTSMYGNVPGYEGSLAGGGKFKCGHYYLVSTGFYVASAAFGV